MISQSPTKGFGLIGMLLLLLVATLGAVAIFEMMISPNSARNMAITTTRVANLRFAISMYVTSHGGSAGVYPPALSSLITTDGVACLPVNTPALTTTYLTLQGWCGPYIDSQYTQAASDYLNDGWEMPFLWSSTTGVITSCGPDRICGDGDDIAFNP